MNADVREAMIGFLAQRPPISLDTVPEDGPGDLEQMAFRMLKNVNSLDGVGEVLVGKVPDPRRAVAEDDAVRRPFEAAARGGVRGAAHAAEVPVIDDLRLYELDSGMAMVARTVLACTHYCSQA